MSRLVDYFVIVGYDHEKDRSGVSSGVILQRFPDKNWEDVPLLEGIEWFCQPQGWALSTERSEPRFFVSVLTDIDANRHYFACLSFNETVDVTPSKPVDEDEEVGESSRSSIAHHSVMYAPKCLAIVSRQDYIDTFRNCLGIIYTVYAEGVGVPLETLVGNLLGCVLVPPPGGPQVRFSIGAGDRQALQPPAAPPLPVTHTSVHMLFQLLGIHNTVTLWCGVMCEHKVLLQSAAAARLSAACRALTALMFPFRYPHVYVPHLPAALADVLDTPTPFLIGVNTRLKDDVQDLMDVIVADLDNGSLYVPPSLSMPRVSSEPVLAALLATLGSVLQPALRDADAAFAPPSPLPSPPHMLDKEIRAVFMRMFAQLLQGYRSCLTLIRIHPSPVLTFHKAGFVGSRGLSTCSFAARVLDCMFFNGFVAERGPPWRPCDIWDELYTNMPEMLRQESLSPELVLTHIQELAMLLHLNENPNPQSYQQRVLRPPEGASSRIHQPSLRPLDSERVQAVIEEGMSRNQNHPKLASLRPPQPRIVPLGAPPSGLTTDGHGSLLLTNSARRLEVLRNCVTCIFEGKVADACKSFPAVLRALRAPAARLALTAELAARVPGNKAVLQHQQFDLIVRLMNCALQDASALDEHGVAAALLPLATAFCRKLCTGVIQFSYMCIQEHPVWSSQQFWEAAFYQDVQRDIKALYNSSPVHQRTPSPREESELRSLLRAQEPSALEIAAEQMRLWPGINADKQQELIKSEESTLYSQAIHFANRMVYLLVPLEGRRQEPRDQDLGDRASNSITNSVAESDSADAESGFEEADPGETGNNVIKFVSRFVDKVCTEGGVTTEHIRCLHQMVPGVVHMHLETLEAVARESRRLPPIQKPRILTPGLVPNESIAAPALRAFLVADGRGEAGLGLLPAEGALFLTNYRIIFKGAPTDPYACEQTVVRSFPITSLTKEKPVKMQYLAHLDQCLQEGLQLRSCTFQLVKVAFDEEVTGEQVEQFRKLVARARHPAHALQHFAFAGSARAAAPLPPHLQQQDKSHTLKGFAKKTLLKTARKAGLKPKASSKRQKYVLSAAGGRSLTSPSLMNSLSADTLSLDELDGISVDGSSVGMTSGMANIVGSGSDARTLERLSERSYARDWQRCGLASEPFRLTAVNANYSICRSYPALLSVPSCVGDDSVRRFARCYRQGRVPALCWKHPRTGALLARSSASHHKGVIGMLKASSHQTQASTRDAGGTETTSSLEQERYMSALAACTPSSRGGCHFTDSTLSLDSLLLAADEPPPLSKTIGTLGVFARGSGGKGGVRQFGRGGSLKERRQGSHADLPASGTLQRQRNSGADGESVSGETYGGAGGIRRAALYVLVDKGNSGSSVGGSGPAEMVPVDYPDCRAAKHAFKKLMRACVPSATTLPAEPDAGFLRLVEESGWLWQLRQLFQLSGAVVDLLDLQGSSVLLSLEDGWDVTAQVSSLAQLCLDPYYRTLDGFRVLVEKEWLALGHRFQQRSNLSPQPQQGFTPTFLQFLDAVHQIQKQFPLAFEFNEFYVRMIAYHSVSCRFRTFLLDHEVARAELGIAAADDKRGSLTHKHRGVETGAGSDDDLVYPGGIPGTFPTSRSPSLGQSLFDYIDKQHQRSPIFYNFLYTPDLDNPVLRPQSSLACLEVWEYYCGEELGAGPPYELEATQQEHSRREERDAANGAPDPPHRHIVTVGYDSVTRCLPDAFAGLLERLRQLELEMGHLPQKWRIRWEQLELPNTDDLARVASFSSALVRRHGRLTHKRSTLEVLVRGRLAAVPAAPPVRQPHRFAPNHHTAPAHCDHCSGLLWGPVKTGVRCVDCGVVCHERCVEVIAAPCTVYKAGGGNTTAGATLTVTRAGAASDQRNTCDTTSVSSSVAALPSSQQYYEQFSSNVAEDRTHEGHLYKRGALLKGWKQRWFVLDSIKHQLRYYDAMEDSHCKGFIDLAEVMAVTQAPPGPGPPKKTDDRSFFDLRTSRRTYNFCASDASSAQEWIEKLQACLQ